MIGEQKTQRSITLGTYKKIVSVLDKNMNVLDYGAGFCHGTKYLNEIGFNAESFEIYPQKNINPDYLRFEDINKQYDFIICNCVINVISNIEDRKQVLFNIYKLLKINGKAIILTRPIIEIEKVKNKVIENDGYRLSNGSFQKGYSQQELINFVENNLKNINIENTNIGKISLILQKIS